MEKSKSLELIDGICNECIEFLNASDSISNHIIAQGKTTCDINNDIFLDFQKQKSNSITSIKIDIPNEVDNQDAQNDQIENKVIKDDTNRNVINSNETEIKASDNACEVKNNHDNLHDTYKVNEEELEADYEEIRSKRLRKLSRQLPRIVITSSDGNKLNPHFIEKTSTDRWVRVQPPRTKRRVTKEGNENVALISNIPFEKMRLLNDAFHTLINLRWRWIVIGTVLVHFGIWFVFAVFWYIAALAHNDFDTVNPPEHRCITGGTDFLNIFLASVEAQTTIGFGDRTIDEECPEAIFLFIMQLIMGTGLSGVLTCIVYAKLTRPENFTKEGVGFSKNAVVSLRDGRLCLMFRVWDLNYDHIIGSEIVVYFIKTTRTKEGEILKHYVKNLPLLQRQLMLWPVTATHVIDSSSPLYDMKPEDFVNSRYEITVSLKGASASMGTYTQSQTSYLPREVLWGGRFPGVVRYSNHEQKYVIDCKNLNTVHDTVTPLCSARRLSGAETDNGSRSQPGSRTSQYNTPPSCPATPTSFTEQVELLTRSRTSSFRRKNESDA